MSYCWFNTCVFLIIFLCVCSVSFFCRLFCFMILHSQNHNQELFDPYPKIERLIGERRRTNRLMERFNQRVENKGMNPFNVEDVGGVDGRQAPPLQIGNGNPIGQFA